jgi:hypothetical protein
MLRDNRVEVWYDEFSLGVGDGLRRAIDKGLANSRFGIVILSPAFFAKNWPQRELDGLVAREVNEDARLVLPVWHNITRSEIVAISPPLADIVAVRSDQGLEAVCNQLLRKIHPDGSPLIVARDELLSWGFQPPVISDEWWLDVVEASNRVPFHGVRVPIQSTWGSWSFPLPHERTVGELRGVRLAWAAMQLRWTEYAEEHLICQMTHPEKVHAFIKGMPGLRETCLDFPHILANYSPFLTLREFSGEFSDTFDEMLDVSVATAKRSLEGGIGGGAALTVDGDRPLCEEHIALRHATFGNYNAECVSSFVTRGDSWAPSYNFEDMHLLVWLLSKASDWVPKVVREFLISGFATGGVVSTVLYKKQGPLMDRLVKARPWPNDAFKWTAPLRQEWIELVKGYLTDIRLEDSPTAIGDRIIELGIFEKFLTGRKR